MTQASTPGPREAGRTFRVTFVAWDYHPVPAGGAEHQARLQAEELARRGHRVTVVTPSSRQTSGSHNGVFVRRLPGLDRRPFRTITFMIALLPYLLATLRRTDVVHIHLAGLYSDLIVLVARLMRTPVYIKIAAGGESGEVARLRFTSHVTRYYGLRHASMVQAISQQIAEELDSVGVAPERIVYIPNGVDTACFPVADDLDRREARTALGLPEEGSVLVYLGRFSEYKGVLDLREAWRSAQPAGASLVLVGRRTEHPPEDEVEVESLPGLTIRDWTDDARPYLRACDALVLASRAEGMSNVMLEAMSTGRPVVATRVGAAEAMIEDGRSGLLVAPGDIEGLATALRCIAADGELRQRMGELAADVARANFSVSSVVDRIVAVYDELTLSPRRQ